MSDRKEYIDFLKRCRGCFRNVGERVFPDEDGRKIDC